ncbi:2-oxo acid dehydrogenase subunit E2 [Leucobacter tardus]|uniref:Dihydrolipoamide acetyltransferase component of pyruvate dehydrogenase complex n=1 Tax=Leucobacter tardus TaxID=501483 RepID=A0A939QD16_9MICO|nr:dihydrolipoamide acetyltransferase family protein [Leucobacter tardus]MBO2988908.1 2-oxo acid dehydrogenase subunit E2 [Leucobacter tardus]
MSAAQVFHLPDLGEGLTEATLMRWLVAVGDEIAVDAPIAEVETAKSVVELPSPFGGVITALHGAEGDTINTGAPVLEVGGDASGGRSGAAVGDSLASAEHEAYREEERAGSGNVLIGYGTGAGPAKGRRRRRTEVVAERAAVTPAQDAAASPAQPVATSGERPRTVAVRSPIVRRLARELGIDPRDVDPTGSDGAVTRDDVLRAADARGRAEARRTDEAGQDPVRTADGPLGVLRTERFSPLRKVVSAKLSRSRSEIPEATVWVDVDITDLWALRGQMAAGPDERPPSFTALLARFALLGLERYPHLASRVSDQGDELIVFDGVNLGVAADTERGLLVPMIERADALSLAQLDAALRSLGADARSGRIPPERLSGSTFTVNNYGSLGVDGSAAIINHPEVAILGAGRAIERPWVVDGEIVPRRIVQLSLVFDHRVCDGGYAAGFLREVVGLLEHPLTAYSRV